jgi:hypothetical protein
MHRNQARRDLGVLEGREKKGAGFFLEKAIPGFTIFLTGSVNFEFR